MDALRTMPYAIAITPDGGQVKLERMLFEVTNPADRARGVHRFRWAWVEVDE